MSAHQCPKCGELRKVDIIWTRDGWDQPPCYHCGDPGYLEPHEKLEGFKEKMDEQLKSMPKSVFSDVPDIPDAMWPKEKYMICGDRTYVPDLGQHRFCTFKLAEGTNSNHDMPNKNNKIKPHRSGEWVWTTPYPLIGPERVEDTTWDLGEPMNECRWCDTPVEEYQKNNVLRYTPGDKDLDTGSFYQCKGCEMSWTTVEVRKNPDVVEVSEDVFQEILKELPQEPKLKEFREAQS